MSASILNTLPPGFEGIVGLGAPVKLYQGSLRRSLRSSDFYSCGCMLPMFGTGLAGLLAALGVTGSPNPVLLAAAALVLVATYGGAALFLRRQAAIKVLECERGIAVARGRQVRTIPWPILASITRAEILHKGTYGGGRPVGGGRLEQTFTVRTEDRYSVVLTDWLPDVGTLADHVEQAIVANRLESSLDAIQTGATIRFGPRLGVSKDALILNGSAVPWQEVGSVEIAAGEIRVTPTGSRRRLTVPVSLVENPALFQAVLSNVLSRHPGRIGRPTTA